MPEVRILPGADADLDEIHDYIAIDNPIAAGDLIEKIERQLDSLAEHPRMGRARPELGPEIHSFAVGSYVIFYRPLGDGVEVVRVLHGARDIGAQFGPE